MKIMNNIKRIGELKAKKKMLRAEVIDLAAEQERLAQEFIRVQTELGEINRELRDLGLLSHVIK